MKFLFFSALCTLPFMLSRSQNWVQYGGLNFTVTQNNMSWSDAEQTCLNEGAHLASIHSYEEYTFIQNLVINMNGYQCVWIGGTDIAQAGVWTWSDGSAFDYTDWTTGMNISAPDNCLFFCNPGNWSIAPCTYIGPSVCAKCQNDWTQFGSHCYQVNTNSTTWSAAEQNCVNMGGHLTSVHSYSQYSFLQSLVLNATGTNPWTWIGGSDNAQHGTWVWSDGSAFDYTDWAPSQPDNLGIEDCIQMNFPVDWNNLPCNTAIASVCAISFGAVTVPSTAVPSTAVPSAAVLSTAVLSTAVPSMTVPSTAVPSTAVPSTAVPSTAVPSTAVLSTAVPSMTVPSMAVPSTAVPSMTVPSTAVLSTAVPSTTVPSTTVPSTITSSQSPENMLIMRLKIISTQDLMVSKNSQLLLQQLKGELIAIGLPSNFTLHLTSIKKTSP